MIWVINWEPGDGTRYELLAIRTTNRLTTLQYDWTFVDVLARTVFFCNEGGYLMGTYVQEKTREGNAYHCDVLAIMACEVVDTKQAGPCTSSGLQLQKNVKAGHIATPTISSSDSWNKQA